jgi:hypothetical protein
MAVVGAITNADATQPTERGIPLSIRRATKAAVRRYSFRGGPKTFHPSNANKTHVIIG